MRKVYLLCCIILMFLTGCSVESGYSASGGVHKSTSVYVGLSVEKASASLTDDVVFTFSHGHNISEYFERDIIGGHLLEVFLREKGSREKVLLYSKEYLNDDYYSEENRCTVTDNGWLSSIEYSQNFEFSINFSDYDMDEGRVYIMITETVYSTDMINGVETAETIYTDDFRIIYFEVKGDKVYFS